MTAVLSALTDLVLIVAVVSALARGRAELAVVLGVALAAGVLGAAVLAVADERAAGGRVAGAHGEGARGWRGAWEGGGGGCEGQPREEDEEDLG